MISLSIKSAVLIRDGFNHSPDVLLLTLDLSPSQFGESNATAKITIEYNRGEDWISANLPGLQYKFIKG